MDFSASIVAALIAAAIAYGVVWLTSAAATNLSRGERSFVRGAIGVPLALATGTVVLVLGLAITAIV